MINLKLKLRIVAMFLGVSVVMQAQIKELEAWMKHPTEELKQQRFARKALSRDEANAASELLEEYWRVRMKADYAEEWSDKQIRYNALKMPFEYRILGDKPADGRSLYISMHGGGNAPAEVNDQQWRNQIMLYTPSEGVYIAPRAAWNDWDMWCKPGMDELLEELIGAAVVYADVNVDKVYLMGYSAGGDGVWRMAPRMADTWAAASMMAGHPGNTLQVNLRNLPYMIWMGEQDKAYDRNRLAVERGAVMDSLQRNDPEGYIHETHIIPQVGHWMLRADTAAVPWMAQYRRQPYPTQIVWRQEEVLRPSFYWIAAPGEELKTGMRVDVKRKGNQIDILSCDYSSLTLFFNDEMCDLDRPVTVTYRGKKLVRKKLKRTIAQLESTLNARGDIRYMFPASITVEIPVTE